MKNINIILALFFWIATLKPVHAQDYGEIQKADSIVQVIVSKYDSIHFSYVVKKIPKKLMRNINSLSKEKVKFQNPGRTFRTTDHSLLHPFVSNKSLIMTGNYQNSWFIIYKQGNMPGIETYGIFAVLNPSNGRFENIRRIHFQSYDANNKTEIYSLLSIKKYLHCPNLYEYCNSHQGFW